MPRLTELCPYCQVPAIEKSKTKLNDTNTLIRLACGHSIVNKVTRSPYDIESLDGKTLKPFQKDGIRFIEDSNFRCLIGDEMGLGKTVQYLGTLKLHPELLPALFVVKAGLKRQLEREIYRWTDNMLIQTIESSAQKIMPFPFTIVGYDTLSRIKDLSIFKFVKTMIIDECQHIQNADSKRTRAVQMLAIKCQIKHIIAVSGTPFKNHLEEFFPILNMLAPTVFPTLNSLVNQYYGSMYRSGDEPSEFQKKLNSIMIRRTRAEVAPELPSINRVFFNSEIANKELAQQYKVAQNDFDTFYNDAVQEGRDSGMAFSANLLGFFARMRKITGLAKIEPVRDFLVDFLENSDNPKAKIVVFGHHKETLSTLLAIMNTWCSKFNLAPCAELKSEMSADERENQVREFRDNDKCRILIASTLAAGEGLNLQFCSDAIIMERQWNPANEEQAETRFTRFGSTANQVNVTYMISLGTIDEWLTQLVESKRSMMGSVMDGKEIGWNQDSLMSELAKLISSKGSKAWSYA